MEKFEKSQNIENGSKIEVSGDDTANQPEFPTEGGEGTEAKTGQLNKEAEHQDQQARIQVFQAVVRQRIEAQRTLEKLKNRMKAVADRKGEEYQDIATEVEVAESLANTLSKQTEMMGEEVEPLLGDYYPWVEEFGVTVEQARRLRQYERWDDNYGINKVSQVTGVLAPNDRVVAGIVMTEYSPVFNPFPQRYEYAKKIIVLCDGEDKVKDLGIVKSIPPDRYDRPHLDCKAIVDMAEDGSWVKTDTGRTYPL